jgi:hypothetical protein
MNIKEYISTHRKQVNIAGSAIAVFLIIVVGLSISIANNINSNINPVITPLPTVEVHPEIVELQKVDWAKLPIETDLAARIQDGFDKWESVKTAEYSLTTSDGDEWMLSKDGWWDFVNETEYFDYSYSAYDNHENFSGIRKNNELIRNYLGGYSEKLTLPKDEENRKKIFFDSIITNFINSFPTEDNPGNEMADKDQYTFTMKTENIDAENGDKLEKYIWYYKKNKTDVYDMDWHQTFVSFYKDGTIYEIHNPYVYNGNYYKFLSYDKSLPQDINALKEPMSLASKKAIEELLPAIEKLEVNSKIKLKIDYQNLGMFHGNIGTCFLMAEPEDPAFEYTYDKCYENYKGTIDFANKTTKLENTQPDYRNGNNKVSKSNIEFTNDSFLVNGTKVENKDVNFDFFVKRIFNFKYLLQPQLSEEEAGKFEKFEEKRREEGNYIIYSFKLKSKTRKAEENFVVPEYTSFNKMNLPLHVEFVLDKKTGNLIKVDFFEAQAAYGSQLGNVKNSLKINEYNGMKMPLSSPIE